MAKYSNLIVVEGVSLPDPSEMKPSDYDITDSERNARGIMVSQIIRADVHKLECKWKILHPDDYAKIKQAISKKFNLSVTYTVPGEGRRTLGMYVGDRTTPVYTYAFGEPVYKDVTINFVEM